MARVLIKDQIKISAGTNQIGLKSFRRAGFDLGSSDMGAEVKVRARFMGGSWVQSLKFGMFGFVPALIKIVKYTLQKLVLEQIC